jgi:galactose-1-phosphate uridylyltransferase
MPQAGSSLVHPHLQVLCGAQPTNHLRLQLEGAEEYFKESGRSFWGDLILAEKDQKERYLGEIGSTVWVMSFVPRSYLPDVWCIFPGHTSLLKVEEGVLDCFLEGLSKVLTFFHEENIFSFNLSIFSVREHDHFRVNAAILPRLFLRDIGNSDHTFLQAVHKETYSVRRPESVCQAMKDRFPDTWRDA